MNYIIKNILWFSHPEQSRRIWWHTPYWHITKPDPSICS